MASGMSPIGPVVVQSSINATGDRRPEPKKGKWWAGPVFGFSHEPDYMNPENKQTKVEAGPARTRFEPGSFTEEKARQLRRMTSDVSSFHDDMYHSAIASRLASDFSDRDIP